MKDIEGKVAVVTGGGFGIGKAAGTLFAENGMKVVLADMNKEVLDSTVSDLKGRGLEVTGSVSDWLIRAAISSRLAPTVSHNGWAPRAVSACSISGSPSVASGTTTSQVPSSALGPGSGTGTQVTRYHQEPVSGPVAVRGQ